MAEQGGALEEAAQRFGDGEASVNRWIARFRSTGSVEPSPHGGGHRHLIRNESLPLLSELLKEHPDKTLPALVDAYSRRTKVTVSEATMGRALARARLSDKKSLVASERERPHRAVGGASPRCSGP